MGSDLGVGLGGLDHGHDLHATAAAQRRRTQLQRSEAILVHTRQGRGLERSVNCCSLDSDRFGLAAACNKAKDEGAGQSQA